MASLTPYRTVTPGPSLKGQIDQMYAAARKQYASGGGFEQGTKAQLARTEQKALSAGMQNLVSAGMAGTTMAGGLGNKFAEEVAAPTLMQMESERAQGLAGIYGQQAGTYAQLEQMRQQQYMQAQAQADAYNIAMKQLGLQRDESARQREHEQAMRPTQQSAKPSYVQGQAFPKPAQPAAGVTPPQSPTGATQPSGIMAQVTMSDGTRYQMGADGILRKVA